MLILEGFQSAWPCTIRLYYTSILLQKLKTTTYNLGRNANRYPTNVRHVTAELIQLGANVIKTRGLENADTPFSQAQITQPTRKGDDLHLKGPVIKVRLSRCSSVIVAFE